MANPLLSPLLKWVGKLRFPTLFLLVAMFFVVDLFVPDFIPFADEIFLGLTTALLASWKNRKRKPSTTLEQPATPPLPPESR
ncbi:MAG: hypothetical protein QM769_10145 [Pseudoxanthomonas sp.]